MVVVRSDNLEIPSDDLHFCKQSVAAAQGGEGAMAQAFQFWDLDGDGLISRDEGAECDWG